MSTVRWYFGATGFMIDIVNGQGNESQFSGQMPVADMDMKFEFVPSGVAPTIAAPGSTAAASSATPLTPMQIAPDAPYAVQTDIYPFAVKANVSFVDEGLIEAEWQVFPNRIAGKGSGKGMGKMITALRSAPY